MRLKSLECLACGNKPNGTPLQIYREYINMLYSLYVSETIGLPYSVQVTNTAWLSSAS